MGGRKVAGEQVRASRPCSTRREGERGDAESTPALACSPADRKTFRRRTRNQLCVGSRRVQPVLRGGEPEGRATQLPGAAEAGGTRVEATFEAVLRSLGSSSIEECR